VPTVKHKNGTFEEIAVPWADRYQRFTKQLAQAVIIWLEACGNVTNGDGDGRFAIFDTAGRLGSVTSPAGTFTYGYRANSMGLVHTVTGPAHTVTNTWNATRDILDLKENKVGATTISSYDYTVNHIGQRTDVAKAGSAFTSTRSIAWGYDVLGQVVMADSSITGFDRAYKYDGIGNRKEAVDSLTLSGTDNYIANALNQYTHVGSIEPVYDLDGNAEEYPVPADLSANSVLGWDAENRLISATVDTVITTYHYDSGSRRIFQTTGSATTVYVYDAWNPVMEFSTLDFETFDLRRSYTWGLDLSGSLQAAGGVGGLLLITDHSALGTPSYFPTFDGNGNVSEYLNGIGTVVAHYEYDPFGRTTVASETKAEDFAHRFSTKPIDSATGLLYYGYRWYDPATGRWPSRDPIEEEGGLNLYGFVGNDGVSQIDYLGLAGEGQDCLETLDHLFTNSSDIKEIINKIKSKGCKVPPVTCECCKGRYKSAGGLHYADGVFGGPHIEMCYNNLNSYWAYEVTLRHELIHNLQYCNKTLNEEGKSRCENSLCAEIEAYYNANCKLIGDATKRKACVKGKYKKQERDIQVGSPVRKLISRINLKSYMKNVKAATCSLFCFVVSCCEIMSTEKMDLADEGQVTLWVSDRMDDEKVKVLDDVDLELALKASELTALYEHEPADTLPSLLERYFYLENSDKNGAIKELMFTEYGYLIYPYKSLKEDATREILRKLASG